jgi:hypothetical protein
MPFRKREAAGREARTALARPNPRHAENVMPKADTNDTPDQPSNERPAAGASRADGPIWTLLQRRADDRAALRRRTPNEAASDLIVLGEILQMFDQCDERSIRRSGRPGSAGAARGRGRRIGPHGRRQRRSTRRLAPASCGRCFLQGDRGADTDRSSDWTGLEGTMLATAGQVPPERRKDSGRLTR